MLKAANIMAVMVNATLAESGLLKPADRAFA